MIVVDTNVISYYWIKSEFSDLAEKAFKKDSQWIAPYLWRSEFRNVLSVYVRKNLLSYNEAFELMVSALEFMEGKEFSVTNEKVFEIIKKSDLSAYDSEFVALADQNNIKLVTSDKKIVASFPKITIFLRDFLS